MTRSYSTTQVQAAVGLTSREIHYWRDAGIVTPSIAQAQGSGSKNRWSVEDVWCFRVLRRLRDAGVALDVAARVIPMLAEADEHRWAYVGDQVGGTCSNGELERTAAELGSIVVVDLDAIRRFPVAPLPGPTPSERRSAEMRETFGKEAAAMK